MSQVNIAIQPRGYTSFKQISSDDSDIEYASGDSSDDECWTPRSSVRSEKQTYHPKKMINFFQIPRSNSWSFDLV